jgi:hypothetical protein
MTRKQWTVYYRLFRIQRREVNKATMDMLIFGTGIVRLDPGILGGVEHVPLMEVFDLPISCG